MVESCNVICVEIKSLAVNTFLVLTVSKASGFAALSGEKNQIFKTKGAKCNSAIICEQTSSVSFSLLLLDNSLIK